MSTVRNRSGETIDNTAGIVSKKPTYFTTPLFESSGCRVWLIENFMIENRRKIFINDP